MASKYSVSIEDTLRENSSHGIILGSIRPHSTILECGSSSGYMTKYLKEELNADVCIVEMNESDFHDAMAYAVDGFCGNLEDEDWTVYYAGKEFDYIIFADVLEHLRNPSEVLAHATRFLKDDGIVITSIPNIAHHDILIKLLHNHWDYMPLGLLDDTHVHFWAQENLEDLFDAAGLRVVKKDYAILPAYGTEQRIASGPGDDISAITAICQRRYGDVYQFVYFSQLASFVRTNEIECVDTYDNRHAAYDVPVQACLDYVESVKQKEEMIDEQHNWIVHQDAIIERQDAIINAQTAHLQAQESIILEQRAHIATQSTVLDNQLAHIDSQSTVLDNQLAYIKEQRSYIELLETQYGQLQSSYHQLNIDYGVIREGYETISNATFWKMSKPLRSLLDVARSSLDYDGAVRRTWRRLKGIAIHTNEGGQKLNQDGTAVFYTPGELITILCTPHTLYVARLIERALHNVGIPTHLLSAEPTVYGDEVHIVICPQMFKNMPNRYISFQMEQTVSTRWFDETYIKRLEHSYAILDYSLKNIEFFNKMTSFGKMFYYLPIDNLPCSVYEPTKPEYDVVFYGDATSPRRNRILSELKEHFAIKVLSEVFDEELYQKLRKARVVVNVHYYENAMLETTRLYETLSLGNSIVVSEGSSDPEEEKRLNEIVDFVDSDDIDSLIDHIGYWLTHEEERRAQVARNNDLLKDRSNAFLFFFYRFLLANDWISFDRFYDLAGDYVTFAGDRICLSLPEAINRRRSFDADNHFGFEVIPGLRHSRGWTGCGLSYKFIMRRAKDQGMEGILVCEDDVLFPSDFELRLDKCFKYLKMRDDWDVFQGLVADAGRITIERVDHMYDQTFVQFDHMISLVLNYYKSSIYESIIGWDETNSDVDTNTIDRALESQDLHVVTTVPFLVGHKEELDSIIWGFNNTQYSDLITKSSEKLRELANEFEADAEI